jgi:hexosaminidase
METSRNVEYMLYPRMFALAEIGWTPLSRKDYANFSEERLPKHLAAFDRTGLVYRVPTPVGQKDTTLWGNEFDITLKSPVKDAIIYYNMEGQDVRESDYIYQSPLHISVPEGEMRQLKTIVVAPSGKRSIVTTTTFANKAPLKSLKLEASLLEPGLKYFLVPLKYASPELIDSGKATKQGVAAVVDPRKINEDDDCSLVYKGYISVNSDQVYTFTLPHKGSELKIDDDAGVKSGNIYNPFDLQTYHYQEKVISWRLNPGVHKIEIRYIPSDAGYRFKMPPSVRLLN